MNNVETLGVQVSRPFHNSNPSRITVALAGNPNSGKTTLFNLLTGLRYKVANYPGVTVEKKEGVLQLPHDISVTLVDLPGIYSLSGHSLDEVIATRLLNGSIKDEDPPTAILVVVDSTNLERNLYLVSQLIDRGIPILVALNMSDLAEARGFTIRSEILSRLLNLPVIPIVAKGGRGIESLKTELSQLLTSLRVSSRSRAWEQFLDSEHSEPEARYEWIRGIVAQSCSTTATRRKGISGSIESILTHRFWGLLIFLALMAGIFQAIFLWSSIPMDFIESIMTHLSELVASLLPEGDLRSLLIDGVISGVGSILVFIPQIAVLFFFLALLEDSGYLSRAALMMDRVLRPFGLQGRSFIPMLSSFACAVPAILSTRTIPSWADRLTTILILPLMSCSARLPVYAVLIGAFIPSYMVFDAFSLQGAVLFAMYLLGVACALSVAWILRFGMFRGKPALFVMEMPPFRRPSIRLAIREVIDRSMLFVKSAGTVILAFSIVLWFLASYPRSESNDPSVQVRESYAGKLGNLIVPVIRPFGWSWEVGVAVLSSFAAREVFVSSLGTVYNIQDEKDTSESLVSLLNERRRAGEFSLASGVSLMVFYVFACQCMSTLAVCRKETGSWVWPAFMFAYMTIVAYTAAFLTFHLVQAV